MFLFSIKKYMQAMRVIQGITQLNSILYRYKAVFPQDITHIASRLSLSPSCNGVQRLSGTSLTLPINYVRLIPASQAAATVRCQVVRTEYHVGAGSKCRVVPRIECAALYQFFTLITHSLSGSRKEGRGKYSGVGN